MVYAVCDFASALIRPKKVREDCERAFRPAGIFRRTLVIFVGHLLIRAARKRAAELEVSGASCRVPRRP